jgi:predicted NUDIX family phosphoesterase
LNTSNQDTTTLSKVMLCTLSQTTSTLKKCKTAETLTFRTKFLKRELQEHLTKTQTFLALRLTTVKLFKNLLFSKARTKESELPTLSKARS